MDVEMRLAQRLILIWLTKAESADENLQNRLKPFYKMCKAKGFLVAVYHSGTQDLYESTRALLLYNKYRLDEIERNKNRPKSVINEYAWSLYQSHMIALQGDGKRSVEAYQGGRSDKTP